MEVTASRTNEGGAGRSVSGESGWHEAMGLGVRVDKQAMGQELGEKFFELQRFDMDDTTAMLDSPRSTVLSSGGGSSNQNSTPMQSPMAS